MEKLETWMDRITNESNLWLNAIKMEDEGNYLKAFLFYLKDSADCIKQNSLVRAALSCSCAADCLANEGNLASARRLYMQTATIYENNANLVVGHSVREALWSYQEAYEYFSLACETDRAQHIYERYVSLSRKVNPFFGEKEAMESLRMRKMELESNSNAHRSNMQVSTSVDNAIENFLKEIAVTYDNKSNQRISQRIFNKILSKDESNAEKSIAN